MLHEVLFSLLGHGCFASSTSDSLRFKSNPSSSFLVPQVVSRAQWSALSSLASIGALYQRILLFSNSLSKHSAPSVSSASTIKRSERQRERVGGIKGALRDALMEVLHWHERQVGKLEERILREGEREGEKGTVLSFVEHSMSDSKRVLRQVSLLCETLQDKHGGEIVQEIHERKARTASGVEREWLEKILSKCVNALLRIVQAWMTHGILLDRNAEFFVQERPYQVRIASSSPLSSPSLFSSNRGSVSGMLAEYEWKSQFTLKREMVPQSIINLQVAEQILFVGKARRVLERSRLQHTASSTSEQQTGQADGADVDDKDEANQVFAAEMHEVCRADKVDPHLIALGIRRYYFHVAAWLRKLVVTDGLLVDQVNFVRDFFLLGRGEFFTSFIDVAEPLLASPPRPTLAQAEATVNAGPWREAAAQSGVDHWPQFASNAFSNLRLILLRSTIDFRTGFGKLRDSMDGKRKKNGDERKMQRGQSFSSTVSSLSTSSTMMMSHVSTTSRNSSSNPSSSTDRSKLSDIVLVGEAAVRNGVVAISSSQEKQEKESKGVNGGGLWHAKKVTLERGWACELSFCHHSAAIAQPNTSHLVAFTIHHDTAVGPTALALGDTPHSGLINAVTFLVEFSPRFSTAQLRVECGDSILRASEDIPILLDQRVIPQDECLYHSLKIEYKIEGEDRVHFVAHVNLLDVNRKTIGVIKFPMDLTQTIHLETGSGRAWVGILAGKLQRAKSEGDEVENNYNKLNLEENHKAKRDKRGGGLMTGAFLMEAEEKAEDYLNVCTWYFSAQVSGEKTDEHDPWRALLTLDMQIDWPLHLVLTQLAVDQYGMMFRFLLCLKRVETALKEAWAILNQTRFKRDGNENASRMRRLMILWRLRSSMAFLVNNLQFHLQVDVIDSLQKELVDKINHAKDFAVVAEAHTNFMEQLITRSFLHNKVIRSTVDTVLRRCLRFCSFVKKFARYDRMTDSPDKDSAMTDLDVSFSELGASFSRDSTFLYALLTRINSNLLLRIDYNNHFSKLAKGDLNYRFHVQQD